MPLPRRGFAARYSPFCLPSAILAVALVALVAGCGGGGGGGRGRNMSQAAAYQITPSHAGSAVFGQPLTFPASPTWSIDLGGQVSYPLIAGGKVFVAAASPTGGYGAMLHALDEATGKPAWGPIAIGSSYGSWVGLAYDKNRVFVVNFNGLMQAFDATTGKPGWSAQLPGQSFFSAAPTAINGIVYVSGAGSGGTLYAVDETNGHLLWTADVENGDQSSPAISTDNDGLFVSYPCQVYKFDPKTGASLWHYDGPCGGGGGKTTAYANGLLYVRDSGAGTIFDAKTGAQVGAFNAGPIPALGATIGFFLNGHTLQGVDLTSRQVLWSFSGDGTLSSAPIVIDQAVVVGSGSGNIYALDARTGAQIWSGNAGAGINGADEQNILLPLTGLGAGERYLVVPAGSKLTAWHIVGP